MAIHGNFARNNLGAHMAVIGSAQATTPGNFFRQAWWNNWRAQDVSTAYLDTAAYPTGYYPPAAYNMPLVAGEMSAGVTGDGDVTADLYPSRNMEAELTGTGTVAATAALVISMAAALTGTGAAAATIIGRINVGADLTGDGELTAALNGYAALVASITGTGDIDATISAKGDMEADITSSGSVLTTANVASAVWGADLSALYSGNQAGALVYIAQQILRNKTKTDPATGVMTVYADDGTTVLLTANVYADASGTTPYDGTTGINLKDRLA